jgi:molecular chaperone HscB
LHFEIRTRKKLAAAAPPSPFRDLTQSHSDTEENFSVTLCLCVKTAMNCPHCNYTAPDLAEFCPECKKILPARGDRSPYQVLGYETERMNVDLVDLETRLFQLSKKFHPDRFAGGTSQEIQYSHDHSSAINNAYRILKNPNSRAKYLVEKELGSIEDKSASVPADMADLFFETHDHLDIIRESNGNPPDDAIRAVNEAEAGFREKVRLLEQELQRKFNRYDEEPAKIVIEEMKEILSHRSYIQSFLRQIDNILGRD